MASDLSSEGCQNHPTYNLFYSRQNVALLVKRIAERTDSPGLTSQFLGPFMQRAIDLMPGLYSLHFFASKKDFVDQVIRHVQKLNDLVVDEVVQEMGAHKGFMDYYYKMLTGNRPLLERPRHSQEIDQSRKSDPIYYRDYTQWHLWSS